ncbi:type I-E CRISPR-associated protein Cas7/Cse4/CasC [Endozoicomonas sp. G2_2]|uniref:type I-E CRISPR-associated protein Cas7/Cse4/CasC n=1 Tax=Endozoicomonas sp. G2_2 TaxID=2821092 RepID=UPI001ADC0F1D|nr:type I-E CRISPR-associated protein Cas7/Cse4/CasC [Endozoicomonas sp. G2_2]MBO9468774.1 type I-E CRISPR-associated protein Cas7/Cse4/CasC [Endozoicomonas sp. G2_2]
MRAFIEFHIIQNFAPSNLNRDDTGAPKDAIFGGHRRARISSQCFKRATRLATAEYDLIDAAHRGIRTKRLKGLLIERLAERDPEEAAAKIESALAAAGLSLSKKDAEKTEYLLFLGEKEVAGFAALIDEHWDELATVDASQNKKQRKAAAPPAVGKKAKALLDGGKAVDIALFGRMLADLPAVNQDAACQVAHALSTHRVEREFDYYTAVDDRGGEDDTGADMIGQIEFNSATLYRYAVLDLAKLTANLQGDRELALSAVEAFTTAFVRAVPSGKQNTFAAHNAPDFIGVSLRHVAPMNLANAFEKPVASDIKHSLTEQSVQRLKAADEKLSAVYSDGNDEWLYLDLTGQWAQDSDKGEAQPNLVALAQRVRGLAETALEA